MSDQNFLGDYQTFSSGNEANPNFHIWAGLVTLSCIVSARVWLDFKQFKIRPNLYVLFLAPPASKKTFAMTLAKRLIIEIIKDNPASIPFSAQCQSKENLVKELAGNTKKFPLPGTSDVLEYTPMSIFLTEFTQFLGDKQTAPHMLDFLTTIWDSDIPYDRSTNLHGKEFIPHPFVTMLACTVPETVQTYLKQDVIAGGFTRRALMILEMKDGDPVTIPEVGEAHVQAYARMKAYAKKLFDVGGEMKWDPEAFAFYHNWYQKHQRNLPGDENTKFYFKSKYIQMLKVATLLSLGKSPELILRKESIEVALAIFDRFEGNLSRVFSGVGRNVLATVANRAVEILAINGKPMLDKQVRNLLFSHADGREQVEILQHLIDSNKIVCFELQEPSGITRKYLALPEHIEEMKKKGIVK